MRSDLRRRGPPFRANDTLDEHAVTNPVWREIWLLYNDPELRLSHEEIGARTDRSPGTVAVTLSRVRALLEDDAGVRHCA